MTLIVDGIVQLMELAHLPQEATARIVGARALEEFGKAVVCTPGTVEYLVAALQPYDGRAWRRQRRKLARLLVPAGTPGRIAGWISHGTVSYR
jgi:hypothetical protein